MNSCIQAPAPPFQLVYCLFKLISIISVIMFHVSTLFLMSFMPLSGHVRRVSISPYLSDRICIDCSIPLRVSLRGRKSSNFLLMDTSCVVTSKDRLPFPFQSAPPSRLRAFADLHAWQRQTLWWGSPLVLKVDLDTPEQ